MNDTFPQKNESFVVGKIACTTEINEVTDFTIMTSLHKL